MLGVSGPCGSVKRKIIKEKEAHIASLLKILMFFSVALLVFSNERETEGHLIINEIKEKTQVAPVRKQKHAYASHINFSFERKMQNNEFDLFLFRSILNFKKESLLNSIFSRIFFLATKVFSKLCFYAKHHYFENMYPNNYCNLQVANMKNSIS